MQLTRDQGRKMVLKFQQPYDCYQVIIAIIEDNVTLIVTKRTDLVPMQVSVVGIV